ncbi:hypothetical protein [Clostridium tagluense]|uniref:hypothetical protein n=1 Tax=Clostridium tagluense TaxID=360422 RepID=UPI001CF5C7B5|nr:hypothetical protein [Clostridium tagluense]MCB2322867.1 hypothetical protein [Clostridium tagluense]WAG53092.1 hypothetical protein LL095_24180 [Clostridium tagluense]
MIKKINELQSQGVKKGQGADVFFKSIIDGKSIENAYNSMDITTVTDTLPLIGTNTFHYKTTPMFLTVEYGNHSCKKTAIRQYFPF